MSSLIHQVGLKVGLQLRFLVEGMIAHGNMESGDTGANDSLEMVKSATARTLLPLSSRAAARSWKRRDPDLEERARCYLKPFAPQLLPLLVVGWNKRMRTTAGVAITSRSEVWLNPGLRSISEEEVKKTLLHELAHLLAQHRHGRRRLAPHGPEWMQACVDLGIPGESRTHQLPFIGRRMKRHYLLRCPGCGESHERVRTPRRAVACLACCRAHNKGVYHERFRLLVTRSS